MGLRAGKIADEALEPRGTNLVFLFVGCLPLRGEQMIEAVIEHVPLHRAFPSGDDCPGEVERKKHIDGMRQTSHLVRADRGFVLFYGFHFAWFARS